MERLLNLRYGQYSVQKGERAARSPLRQTELAVDVVLVVQIFRRVLQRVLGMSEGELVRRAYADLAASPKR